MRTIQDDGDREADEFERSIDAASTPPNPVTGPTAGQSEDRTMIGAIEQERVAFEKWAVAYHGKFTLSDPDAGSMWSAWQARAAVEAAKPAPEALSHSAPETLPQCVLDLLAVLNRDGGHYRAKHGLEAACKRATERYCEVLAAVEAGALTDARRQAVVDAVNAWQSLRGTNADLDAAIVAALSRPSAPVVESGEPNYGELLCRLMECEELGPFTDRMPANLLNEWQEANDIYIESTAVHQSEAVAQEPAAVIETADHIRHIPSGEDWLVAYVRGGYLVACGWPESRVPLTDCRLLKKATPEARLELLETMSTTSGSRGEYARSALAAHRTASATARSDEPKGSTESKPVAEEPQALRADAMRYRWLRDRPLETIAHGGVFAGLTPDNVVLNREDLDAAIDAALAASSGDAT